MLKDKKQTCKDVYDRYHKFPGDTSEGRVLTVLFSIIGAIISTIGFYLYLKYKHIVPLMISFCLIYIYMEHMIRDRADYETRVKYIYENPIRWYYDELYAERPYGYAEFDPQKAKR